MAESRARQRWKMLAAAVRGNCNFVSSGSIREFSTFNLVQFRRQEDRIWNSVYIPSLSWCPGLEVRAPPEAKSEKSAPNESRIDIDSLIGFNNTGNVCIWPSEEVAAFWCARNPGVFRGKSVLELGAGMTGLAGLTVALTSDPEMVVLTDGNSEATNNIQLIVDRNENILKHPVLVTCYRWGSTHVTLKSHPALPTHGISAVTNGIRSQSALTNEIQAQPYLANHPANQNVLNKPTTPQHFDVIMAHDCFFFDESRDLLVQSILTLLPVGGCGYFFAPSRDGTLQKFLERLATESAYMGASFDVAVSRDYDPQVTEAASEAMSNMSNVFIAELHYPLLVTLQRRL